MRPHDRRLEAVRAGSAAAIEENQHIVNLLLVLTVLAVWFLMNHQGLLTPPPP
jgi:hypothetical protein